MGLLERYAGPLSCLTCWHGQRVRNCGIVRSSDWEEDTPGVQHQEETRLLLLIYQAGILRDYLQHPGEPLASALLNKMASLSKREPSISILPAVLHRDMQSFTNMSVRTVELSTEREGRKQLRFYCVTRSPAERQRWKGAPLGCAPAYRDNKRCSAAAAQSGWANINGLAQPGVCFSSELPDYLLLPCSIDSLGAHGWMPPSWNKMG